MKFQKVIFAVLTIFILHFISSTSYAISPAISINSHSSKGQRLSATDQLRVAQMRIFVNMTVEDYGKLSGKKLNFFERFSFKASQRRMRLMLKTYDYGDGLTTLQKISWLIKSLLFGPFPLIRAIDRYNKIGFLFTKPL